MSVDEWRKRLADLQDLWAELEVTQCRQDVMVRQSGSSTESPLVMRLDATDVMWRIRDTLQTVASVYDIEAGQRIRYRDARELMHVLTLHAGWVDRHSGSPEWMDTLSGLARAGWQVVDRPPDMVRLGLCGGRTEDGEECRAEVWHEQGAERVQCQVCGATHDVGVRKDQDLSRAARFRAPLSVVVSVLASSGVRVTEAQARKWVQRRDSRGRPILEHASVRSDGVRLYELGSVLHLCGSRRTNANRNG